MKNKRILKILLFSVLIIASLVTYLSYGVKEKMTSTKLDFDNNRSRITEILTSKSILLDMKIQRSKGNYDLLHYYVKGDDIDQLNVYDDYSLKDVFTDYIYNLEDENNHETKQQCIYGIGDIHLESVVAKLKSKFKIDVKLSDMKISYRETIRKSYTQRTKFKKQSGGHGQYGEVEILFEPTKDYSQSYTFKEKVFGGAVPKAYFPAVEKGLIESVKEGVIGHYPVLGIQATLLDGSYHSVDSSEQAFKTATMMCFKEAMKHLDPCLLEPYVILNIYIDEEYLGDLMSHVNKKRGKVLETDSLDDGLIKLVCRIPQVEILEFAIDLRSITQGQGLYDYHFDGYEIVNDDLVERLLKK